jgi:hypothetical protein
MATAPLTPLTLRESRTYGALAVATALTASAGLGALTDPALGAVAAVLTAGGALAAVRLFVTCPAT